MDKVFLDTGMYHYSLSNVSSDTVDQLRTLYDGQVFNRAQRFVDFQLDFVPTSFVRRLIKPQVALHLGDYQIFNPTLKSKVLASLEWGLNWCVASYDLNRLIVHASVIVKDGKAIIFPAAQGSGKSTLSCLMASQGWRLYSDEMAIIDLDSFTVLPNFRPACLKNEAINVVREFNSTCAMGPLIEGTQKGTIAHTRFHTYADYCQFEPAKIVGVVSVKYKKGEGISQSPLTGAQCMAQLIQNSFNYGLIGQPAFEAAFDVANKSTSLAVRYSDIDQMTTLLDTLIQ